MIAPACDAAVCHPARAVPNFCPTDRSEWHTAGNAAGRRPGGRPDDRTNTVTRMWRTEWTGTGPLVVLVALVALGLAAGGRAQTVDTPTAPRALASNGAVVVMPDLAGLDCAGMSQVLRRIDLSNYRGLDPVPVHTSDEQYQSDSDEEKRSHRRQHAVEVRVQAHVRE